MQGGGATAEAYGMPRACMRRKSFFKFLDLRTCSESVGAQHINHGLNVFFIDGLSAIRQECIANGSSAV